MVICIELCTYNPDTQSYACNSNCVENKIHFVTKCRMRIDMHCHTKGDFLYVVLSYQNGRPAFISYT